MGSPTAVYIDYNFSESRYPNKPSDGNSFYTHGFGGLYARQFNKFNPGWNVECWKADPRIRSARTAEIEGVTFRMFPSIRIPRLGQYSGQMIRHFQRFSKERSNVVYNISGFDHLLFYTLARRMKHVPLIVQHHGESTIRYKLEVGKKLPGIVRNFLVPLERNAFRNINKLYVLDNDIRNWLPAGIAGLNVEVRTTGVDENIFPLLDKREVRKLLGLEQDKRYLLYVGRLNNTKRPDILIDIFNELKQQRPDLKLMLLGHEREDGYFQKATDSGALMKGVIPQNELSNWLNAADIYFLPQLDKSHAFGGLGMLPVQAMLCNTPVIGGTLKCFPSEHLDKVGILASDHETIQNGITDILDGEKSFKDTRTYAINYFSWQMISEKTAADYKDLLKESRNE